jgi:L-lactate dehydrogenase complex protein LldG
MNRDTFLQQVRHAVLRGNAFQVATRDLPPSTGYVGVASDYLDRMAREVSEVGGIPHRCEHLTAARDVLADLLRKHRPKSALCWEHPLLEQLGLVELLNQAGTTLLSYSSLASLPAEERRARMLSADIGITSADYAIAETGTLAICARPGQERVASLLPPLYVSVIHREQVLPDLFDLFQRLEATGLDHLPSNVTLITGPSKTGDIELHLTTGVHGPGTWHVLLIG